MRIYGYVVRNFIPGISFYVDWAILLPKTKPLASRKVKSFFPFGASVENDEVQNIIIDTRELSRIVFGGCYFERKLITFDAFANDIIVILVNFLDFAILLFLFSRFFECFFNIRLIDTHIHLHKREWKYNNFLHLCGFLWLCGPMLP